MSPVTIDKSALASGLCDWPSRLERERELLEATLSRAPSRRIIDLGCGEGHHVRFLAQRGCEVVGIDASEPVLDRAQAQSIPEGVQFILTDLGAVERSVHGQFGAALCLGNTLAHLLSPESVSRMLIGLRRRLLPGAPVLLHGLNYDRILDRQIRSLPVALVPTEENEIALFDLVRPREDGIVLHTLTAVHYRPGGDPPVELAETFQAQLRGWRRAEIETMLEVARFSVQEIWGDMERSPYTSDSTELVVLAS